MHSQAPDGVFDALPTGVIVVGPCGTIERLNARGVELLDGIRRVGEPIGDLFGALDGFDGGQQPRYVELDGGLDLVFRVGPMPDQRSVIWFDLVAERAGYSEAERHIQYETVVELLPSLLHDLRNPLAAISSSVELLIEDQASSTVRAELEEILVEVRRMDLAFQGMGVVGRSLVGPRGQQIDRGIAEVIRLMRPSAQRAGVILHFEMSPMPMLHLEPAVVRAVVYNLVDNALVACARGDEIAIRTEVLDSGRAWRLVVHDTGCGMSPEVLDRCTELFFSTRANGSGIGLSTCLRLVHEAGGTLKLLSTRGRGTRVEVEVPALARTQQMHGDEA